MRASGGAMPKGRTPTPGDDPIAPHTRLHSVDVAVLAREVALLSERVRELEAQGAARWDAERPTGTDEPDRAVFRRQGDVWVIAFQGRTVVLRDMRGLRHLAQLLRRPWCQLPAMEVAGASREGWHDPERPGRDRLAAAERARTAVTKGLKAAIDRIAAEHSSLGRHLIATVHRGYLCAYTPDPRHPIRWES